jgi:hypothetical protein
MRSEQKAAFGAVLVLIPFEDEGDTTAIGNDGFPD